MEIIVNSKKYKNIRFIIDDSDYELIKSYTLNVSKKQNGFYLKMLKGKYFNKYVHRVLLGDPKGREVDHVNRNPQDNRRSNLRLSTHAQNTYNRFSEKQNTSEFKGVYWAKDKSMWCARINYENKCIQGGYFKCKIDAAHRYNELALQYYGEFAYLNTFTKKQLDSRLNEPKWGAGLKRCKSGYKGVYEMSGRFIAHIRVNGKKVHIGCYVTNEEAARAYNREAVIFFGENTYLNKV